MQYPSGVYASSRSCSTSSTSEIFFAASSLARPATPLPITSALTVLEVSLAICCAAASVSKLVLFHLPFRCSAMTRIFMCYLSLDRATRVILRPSGEDGRRISTSEEPRSPVALRFFGELHGSPQNDTTTTAAKMAALLRSPELQTSASRPALRPLLSAGRSRIPSFLFLSARRFFPRAAWARRKHRAIPA